MDTDLQYTMDESEPLTRGPTVRYKPRHLFIAVALLLLSLAFELYGLFITQYVYDSTAAKLFPNSTIFNDKHQSMCNVNKSSESFRERTIVQQTTAKWDMYKSIAEAVPAVITSSVLGTISDRYGRRKALTVNLTLTFLGMLFTTIGVKCSFNIYFFLLFAAINNMAGGFYGAMCIGFAYVSDITESGTSRSLFITLFEASIGIGMTVSGLVSGYIIEQFGFFYTSLCSCLLLFIAVVVAVFLLPESLTSTVGFIQSTTVQSPIAAVRNNNTEASGSDIRTNAHRKNTCTVICDTVKASFEFYFRSSEKRFAYIVCVSIFVSACFSRLGKERIEILYALNVPFCWSAVKIGRFTSISVASSMVVGITAIKLLQRFFVEDTIAILSAISNASSYILESVAFNDPTLFLVPLLAIFGLLSIPMVRAILSKMTPPHKQGALFAGIAAMEICVSMTANVVMKIIYINTVETFRGTVFLVYASFSILAIGLLIIYRCMKEEYKDEDIALT